MNVDSVTFIKVLILFWPQNNGIISAHLLARNALKLTDSDLRFLKKFPGEKPPDPRFKRYCRNLGGSALVINALPPNLMFHFLKSS